MIKESRPANECRPSVGEAALESFSKQEAHALPLVARLNGAHHPFSLSLPPQTTTRRFEAVQTTTSDLGLLFSYFLSASGPFHTDPRAPAVKSICSSTCQLHDEPSWFKFDHEQKSMRETGCHCDAIKAYE